MKIYAYNPKGFIYVINRTNTSLISIRCSLSYCELGDIFEMSNVLMFHYYDDAIEQFKKDAQRSDNQTQIDRAISIFNTGWISQNFI